MVETELHHLLLVRLLLVVEVVEVVHMKLQLLLVVQVEVVQVVEDLLHLYVQQERLTQEVEVVVLATLIKQVLLEVLVLLSFVI
jgi:hypothetical protein